MLPCYPGFSASAGRDGIIHCNHLSIFLCAQAGRDGMIHYGQLVPRGLYGWGGYGGSGEQETLNYQTVNKKTLSPHDALLDKQNDCCSFPLGQGEAAWLRLHPHLSCLVRKCHSESLILDKMGPTHPHPPTLDEKRPKNVVYSRSHRRFWQMTKTVKDKNLSRF